MKTKITVTIAIPAYNSQENIGTLLTSLQKQEQKYIVIKEIMVYADGCTDHTAQNVRVVARNAKIPIRLIEARRNRGLAYGLQVMMRKNRASLFVILNDDIKITQTDVIEKLTAPMARDKKLGMVGGNIKALSPKSFIGRCIYTSYLAYREIRHIQSQGISEFTVDGKIMALRQEVIQHLDLNHPVGNVDMYLYLRTKQLGWKYFCAYNASIWFRLPETAADFRNQELRTQASIYLMKREFGHFKERILSKSTYLWAVGKVFVRYPVESLIFKLYINRIPKDIVQKATFSKWQLASTTKRLK